jgi:hydroxymethylbilane synthase
MATSGDRGAPADRSPAGIKGLFVAEIVQALQEGLVDLAVHSAKDLPSEDPEDVVVVAVPPRASPFDVLVKRDPELADGARVGSSSLRRRAQLRRIRPDAEIVEIRGNVDTRLRKMRDGEVDALVLAEAGLARLGIEGGHVERFSADDMVPAPGQGALAVQTRADHPSRELVAELDDRSSRLAFDAERMMVNLLGGGCALPLGAYASLHDGAVKVTAIVLRPDGSTALRAEGSAGSPEEAAREVAERLIAAGARAILAELG